MTTSPSPSAVELVGVSKSFGSVQALCGLTLGIRAGELTALLGPNGAGKTTAISLMLGLARPTAGVVRALGGDPAAGARSPGLCRRKAPFRRPSR
jgi:ABC-2 type transport system ATP-binding protein